jgi:PAS domain S-box-containing protein
MLWASAVLVTLLLTAGIASFSLPMLHLYTMELDALPLRVAVNGLIGLVLLFDIYTIYLHLQVYRIRHYLMQREELFRLISENAADMIAVVGIDGRRIYNSPSYAKVLGYAPEELEDTPGLDQVHPDDRHLVEEAAKVARTGGVGQRIEYRMRHKDGSWRLLESTASTIRNNKGEVEKLIIVNRDISGRRHLEEQFRQAQKMEAIGRLSGGVAHDFNNLLGVMIGYAEFLQDHLKEEKDPLRQSVDEILKAGRRAASLTRQLLAFSRQQVLDPKVLDLDMVISDMSKMLLRLIREDIELSTLLEKDLGKVKADQGQVEQVILNLVVNARDAMPQGGKLLIQTENVVLDEIFVRQYPYPVKQGPYICLTVADNGVGMDAETRARAFEPFFTTKEKGKGTGLGLSMVYGIVKQSGGYIDIHSSPGAGTTFKIYLPRTDEVADEDKSSEEVVRSHQGNETVLVVEDEDSLRTLTRHSLELCGYTVLEGKNGVEASEISRGHQGTIELLLTDIVMPGMNGRALAEEITRQRPEIKVVYMSGYTGQTIGEQGPVKPGSFFLAKPFTRETLTSKIREALGSSLLTQSK